VGKSIKGRFFPIDIENVYIDVNKIIITRKYENYHHIKNVLAIKKGKILKFRYLDKLYVASFEGLKGRDELIFSILKSYSLYVVKPKIHLFQSFIKGNRWDILLEKAVEVGVDEIFPIYTDRVVVRVKEKKARWDRIVRSAAYQSGREKIPKIHSPMTLEKAIKIANGTKIVFEMDGLNFNELESMVNTQRAIYSIFIGPEGGFSDREKELFREKEFFFVSLSPYILRSETAGIVAISLLIATSKFLFYEVK